MINLKKLRKSKKLTQTELANLLGIKQQQYLRYEKGRNDIPLKMFLKILDVCDYKIKLVKKGRKEI